MKLRILMTIVAGILLICTHVLARNFEFSAAQTLYDKHDANFHSHKQKRSMSKSDKFSPNTCVTQACFDIASKIINNMNTNVDPCDDFSEFVCGGFKAKHSIPDEKYVVSPFEIIADKIDNQLRETVSDPIIPDEPAHVKIIKNFYNSCIDEQAIEERGHVPLIELLEKLGGWPVLKGNNWDESNFSWTGLKNSLDNIQNSGNSFISIEFTVDYKDNTKQVMLLDQPIFGISREFLLEGMNNSHVMSYYRYMVDIAVLLGAPRREAEEELLDSLEFERQLANISLPLASRRNVIALYNPMSLWELTHRYPTIPWKTFFNKMLEPKVNITDNEILIVHVPRFLSKLEVLIKETSGRTQANYALWKFIATVIPHLSNDLRLKQLEYMTKIEGKAKNEVRWKQCLRTVSEYLPLPISSLYVKKYFNQEAKNTAFEMFGDIKNVLYKILEEIDWMDEQTRQNALEKARSIIGNIGYPDELLDEEQLQELLDGLELTDNNYFENILNILLFYRHNTIAEFRKPFDRNEWVYHGESIDVNAYYSFLENSIEFPAAVLQENLFNHNHPKYMNYGGIGFMIAHELTHAFDDQGRLFDKTGKLVNWWALSTKEKFLHKVECIEKQYSDYSDSTGLHVNGKNTLGENIADNGGVKIAYLAYKEWISRNSEEQLLPGLDFTQDQLFWISAANVWCSKRRSENLKTMFIEDIHSPEQFRIIGPLSNMIEFSHDFNCSAQTKMNPINKCAICSNKGR